MKYLFTIIFVIGLYGWANGQKKPSENDTCWMILTVEDIRKLETVKPKQATIHSDTIKKDSVKLGVRSIENIAGLFTISDSNINVDDFIVVSENNRLQAVKPTILKKLETDTLSKMEMNDRTSCGCSVHQTRSGISFRPLLKDEIPDDLPKEYFLGGGIMKGASYVD